MHIIASMTTIPARIAQIRPAVESVLNQTVPVDRLEMNIPHVCARTGEAYTVPEWLANMDRVTVHRTDDYGSITKVAPTFLRRREDGETFVWSVDDDYAYATTQLSLLTRHCRPDQRRILTRHGGTIDAEGNVTFNYGLMRVSMFEGFGGVLYPPGCIGDDFLDYVKRTSENDDCRKSDDMVLSLYFAARGIEIFLCNSPTRDEPFMPGGSQPYSGVNSLNREDGRPSPALQARLQFHQRAQPAPSDGIRQ